MSLESQTRVDIDFQYKGGEIHSDEKWMSLEGHTCVILDDQEKMIVIGGNVFSPKSFIYFFDSNEWVSVPSPISLSYHTSVLVRTSSRSFILLYGGKTVGRFVDSRDYLYEIDLELVITWKEVKINENPQDETSKKQPGGRRGLWGHSAELSPDGEYMYVFGGGKISPYHGFAETLFNDLWIYNIFEKTWTFLPQTNTGPCARFQHSSAIMKDENKMLIFGGYGVKLRREAILDDFWEFDFISKSWNEIKIENSLPNILPRCNFGMTIINNENHIQTNRLIIGPGRYSSKLRFSDHPLEKLTSFWELDLSESKKKWRMIPKFSKDLCYGYSMFQFKGRIFLFGGRRKFVDSEELNQKYGTGIGFFSQKFTFLKIPERLYESIDFDLKERLEYFFCYIDEAEIKNIRICVKGMLEDLNILKILLL